MNHEAREVAMSDNSLSELSYTVLLSRILIGATIAIGGFSLFSLLAFLVHGGFNFVECAFLTESTKMVFNASLCMLFFLQHSGMVRKTFRTWLSSYIDKAYHYAFYAISSGIALLSVVILWQNSEHVVFSVQGAYRWLFYLVFVSGFMAFQWGVRELGSLDMFGIDAIKRRSNGDGPPEPIPFTVRGAYKLVRHPLYLFSIIMIWSCPNLSYDRLLFNVTWTIWIVIGSFLEERDMLQIFGEEYRNYQKKVPMLIPLKLRKR